MKNNEQNFNEEKEEKRKKGGFILLGSLIAAAATAGVVTALVLTLTDKDSENDKYVWDYEGARSSDGTVLPATLDKTKLYEMVNGEYSTSASASKDYVPPKAGEKPKIKGPDGTEVTLGTLSVGQRYESSNWHETVDPASLSSDELTHEDEIDVAPFGETIDKSKAHKVNTFGLAENDALWKVEKTPIYPGKALGEVSATPTANYFLGYKLDSKFDGKDLENLTLIEKAEIIKFIISKHALEILPETKVGDNPFGNYDKEGHPILLDAAGVEANKNNIIYALNRGEYLQNSDIAKTGKIWLPSDGFNLSKYPVAVGSPLKADPSGNGIKGTDAINYLNNLSFDGTSYQASFLNTFTNKTEVFDIDTQDKYRAVSYAFIFESIQQQLLTMGHEKHFHGYYTGLDMDHNYTELMFMYGTHIDKVDFSYNDVDFPEASWMTPDMERFYLSSKGKIRPIYIYKRGLTSATPVSVHWFVTYHGVRVPSLDYDSDIPAGTNIGHAQEVPKSFIESMYNHGAGPEHEHAPYVPLPEPTDATSTVKIHSGGRTYIIKAKKQN